VNPVLDRRFTDPRPHAPGYQPTPRAFLLHEPFYLAPLQLPAVHKICDNPKPEHCHPLLHLFRHQKPPLLSMMKIYHNECRHYDETLGWAINPLICFAFYPDLFTGILPE
jgi:hypothetical protein